ncbi:hypothetical protein [Desulfosediminicola ganghwensis]|uniref:hypothetical protein n=1 Tax=Desulfosediminicola ganghwensis TaxID=2569540 RepID=UPI0010AC1784|nr:hypothetical protein [Desulfosediminicola ganghwensis]
MEMHKIEVYTQQKELTQLLGNLPDTPCLVGALDVSFRHKGGQDSVNASADTRVEIFTGENPTELVGKLSALENVVDIQSYPCQSFLARMPLKEEKNDVHSDMEELIPQSSVPANCRVSILSEASIRMTIDSTLNHSFLYKIFHVLAIRDMAITGGRKYRQGNKDFITFTTAPPTVGNIQRLQDEIKDMLEKGELSESTPPDSSGAVCDDITITVDASGNLPALIIRATGNVTAARKSLQEIFCRQKLDTVIARFTARENGIEDIYYLKPLSNTGVTEELARSIEGTLLGEKR